MLHHLLVNASDIAVWADRLESRSTFPELVRRLVLATTPKLTHIDFPSGEGVQVGGWDGITQNEEPTAFVPVGITGWELGTDNKPKGKADKDLFKRSANPLELVPSEATYVFVTLRRWNNRKKWVSSNTCQGIWQNIKAYDADILATWLIEAPAVHIWLSGLLGKRPAGVQDLYSFWEQWSAVTNPPTPAALLLAGRHKSVEKIQDWLRSRAGVFSIQADNRKEAVAILAATILQIESTQQGASFAKAVVVESSHAWEELVNTKFPLLLIPLFDDEESVAGAITKGHQVYVPQDRTGTRNNTETPTRIAAAPAKEALEQLGLYSERAWRLANLARRSLAAYRRRLAVSPSGKQPSWCNSADSQVLLAAALAGAWVEHMDMDKSVLEKLASRPYVEIENELIKLSHAIDPPVRRVGGTWYVVDKADVWGLVSRFLPKDLLTLFSDVVVEVLGSSLLRFDLAPDERYLAGIKGKAGPNSGALRMGLADSLGMLRTEGSDSFLRDNRAKQIVGMAVKQLLDKANKFPSLWGSLSNLLPLLAEASPEEFLAGVEAGTTGPDAPVMSLFEQSQGTLFPQADHPSLLRALEILAWSPSFLAYASKLLARLARLDPGGNLRNRPKNSLLEIFLPWLPHTGASLSQRLGVLDLIRKVEPDASWELLLLLLSSARHTSFGSHGPVWQDWTTEPASPISVGEYKDTMEEVANRALEDVGVEIPRWVSLIELLPNLYSKQRKKASIGLVDLSKATLDDASKASLQTGLRLLIHHHRPFPEESWSLDSEELDRLEEGYLLFAPSDLGLRFSWLFNQWPYLLSGERRNSDKYLEDIREERLAALTIVFENSGMNGILSLIPKVGDPFSLGVSLAGFKLISESELDRLWEKYLAHADQHEKLFARGLMIGMIRERGEEWGLEKVVIAKEKWTAAQQADWLSCFRPYTSVWKVAETLGEEAEKEYWRLLSPYGINEQDTKEAFNSFLKHNRPLAALNLALLRDHMDCIAADTLMDTLEAAISSEKEPGNNERLRPEELDKLLEFIVDSGTVDIQRIARIEFTYLGALNMGEIKPRVLERELASSPSFFAEILRMHTRSSDQSDDPSVRGGFAANAFTLIYNWRTIPGMAEDGSIDGEYLLNWIKEAMRMTSEMGRGEIAEQYIGQMLSSSPSGRDGAWPHESIREVLEALGSGELEKGLEIGKFNSRGVTSRNPFEGGALERMLENGFSSDAAKICILWPRTAAMLRRLANTYQGMAAREDIDAELTQDFNF